MADSPPSQIFPTFQMLSRRLAGNRGTPARSGTSSAIGVAIILTLAVVYLLMAAREQRTEKRRAAEFSVLRTAIAAETDFAGMESAYRSYIATGEPTCLAQFDSRSAAFQNRFLDFIPMLQGDPSRRENIRQLGYDFHRWREQFARPAIAARQAGTGAATLPEASGADSALLASLRDAIGGFARASNELLENRTADAELQRQFQTAAFAMLIALAVGFLVASSWSSAAGFRRHLERAESAVAQTRAIIDNTLDGVITVDESGVIQSINPAAERMFAQRAAQVVGRSISLLAPRHLFFQEISNAGHGSLIALGQRAGGQSFPIEVSVSPMEIGGRRQFVAIIRDVSEKQRIEDERQKADKLESLGVVAGGIAHDFNNLLTTILGNLSLVLISPEIEGPLHDRLAAAKKATGRAQELAQQLLTFARGGAPIKQTAFLPQLIRDTLSATLHASATRSVLDLPEGLWPVEIDPGQISQVLNNIGTNAHQAMPAGGVLRVHAENVELHADSVSLGLRAGRWVKVSLQDQGGGIPEAYLKKIFDPYFTTKPKGTGLGLAAAYSIIKNHGGVICAESLPGAGATFTICLPASEKEVRPANSPAALTPGANQRILVIDDDEDICMLVVCTLAPLGYDVTEANDGLGAIAAYESAMRAGRRYDLVISDLTMPGGLGGAETLERLREIDPEVRAIVSSGYANDPVMSRHEDYGFFGMIAKPYEIDALSAKVAETLAAPRRKSVIYHDFERRKSA